MSLLQRTGDRMWEAPDEFEGGMQLRQERGEKSAFLGAERVEVT